jgi:hypothetical protein
MSKRWRMSLRRRMGKYGADGISYGVEPLLERRVLHVRLAAQFAAQLAQRRARLRDGIMFVDALEIDLPRQHEGVVRMAREYIVRVAQHLADDIFNEPWRLMRFVHDEQLVRAFEQIVSFRRHRLFDDLDERPHIHLLVRADHECSHSSLIMGRNGDRGKDFGDVFLREAFG